jgi:hypothetical protein
VVNVDRLADCRALDHPYPDSPHTAVVLPIKKSGQEKTAWPAY